MYVADGSRCQIRLRELRNRRSREIYVLHSSVARSVGQVVHQIARDTVVIGRGERRRGDGPGSALPDSERLVGKDARWDAILCVNNKVKIIL